MNKLILTVISILFVSTINAQIIERERPTEWKDLIYGGRFMDRFLPMEQGKLSSKTWGASYVKPRYIDNGIEDSTYSYWGGKIIYGPDKKYHLFVNAWYENNPNGHMGWMKSFTMHAVADKMSGQYNIDKKVCDGTNPEIYVAKDGTYVLYVLDKWKPFYYTSNNLYGPWEKHPFKYDACDRTIIDGLSNLTFAKREDGSQIMICRGGGVWISRDGLDTFYQVSNKTVYPAREGRFEDPVIWRDNIQYNLIVNDWYGRIAYYLRSKDGINWVEDDGEAYTPDIAVHKDGTREKWFKFERIKVFQDKYGRPIQANFAVCDTLKQEDKSNDTHSGKNICIPLNPGMLMSIVNKSISSNDKSIDVKIIADEYFNPQKDINISSLRFGKSYDVNRGRGCKVINSKKSGKDLILTFDIKKYMIPNEEFALKIIGKDKKNMMIFGYARNPNVNFNTAILSTRKPILSDDGKLKIEVRNLGQIKSSISDMDILESGKSILKVTINPINPYESNILDFDAVKMSKGKQYILRIKGENVTNLDYDFVL